MIEPNTVSLSQAPLFPSFGLRIQPDGRTTDLQQVRLRDAQNWYRSHGTVLLRGFASSIESVADFAGAFLAESVVNGNAARQDVMAAGKIQTVNSGNDLIPLHAEMAYGPIRPDVLLFYCVHPPQRGSGETLLCDGVTVWKEMAPATRRRFEEQRIRYTFRRSPMLASQCSGHQQRVAADARVVECTRHEDGTLDLTFVVSAVTKSNHGGHSVFANSVIVERDSVAFDDGTPSDDALRRELFVLTTSLAHKIVWEAGDLLLVDNSRVMHGRRQIAHGDNRKIVLTMGWEREVQDE